MLGLLFRRRRLNVASKLSLEIVAGIGTDDRSQTLTCNAKQQRGRMPGTVLAHKAAAFFLADVRRQKLKLCEFEA